MGILLLCYLTLQVIVPSWAGLSTSRQNLAGSSFRWGRDAVRGVNLGGWLVLEPWITPSIFADKPDWVVDERNYGAYMRTQRNPLAELRSHWNDWIQKKDLQEIADAGLNLVRIPIGYWSLVPLDTGEPYLAGAFDYLKLAVNWAQQLGLFVMIDLHGSPGSQNGFDNSGLRGPREWFWNQTNAERSVSALRILVREFTQPAYDSTVTAIGLINEPFPLNPSELDYLRNFYQAAYWALRGESRQAQLVLALDAAFQGLPAWHNFMLGPTFYDVVVDTHSYAMFNNYTLVLGYNQNLDWICGQVDYFRASNQQHWTVIGEFTPATTDCARWLNGRGKGAGWDNSLSGSYPLEYPGNCQSRTGRDSLSWDSEYRAHLARSFQTQTYVYEQASGWIMWTWKNEEADDWSMQRGLAGGWIPTPVWNRTFDAACDARQAQAISGAGSKRSPSVLLFIALLCVPYLT